MNTAHHSEVVMETGVWVIGRGWSALYSVRVEIVVGLLHSCVPELRMTPLWYCDTARRAGRQCVYCWCWCRGCCWGSVYPVAAAARPWVAYYLPRPPRPPTPAAAAAAADESLPTTTTLTARRWRRSGTRGRRHSSSSSSSAPASP